jgi:leader peptidase (prepilin peptidase)/N-methyltransferase
VTGIPAAALVVLFGAVGAIAGSFANVCIHRLPRGESVVHPPSRCPKCGARVAFYDNVPVLSWLVLRGRCRSCAAPISPRYPLVEAAGAAIFAGAALLWGPTPVAAGGALLALACVILVATDLETRTLPDEVTLGTLALGLVVAAVRDGAAAGPGEPFLSAHGHLVEAALGAAAGAAFLELVRRAYAAVRGGEGMGGGDVKMLAMAGAFTGPAGVFLTLFFASLSGTAVAGGAALVRRARWALAFAAAKRDASDASALAKSGGLLVGDDGTLASAGGRWREIPGAAAVGERVAADRRTAGRLLAFLRLARVRARRGEGSASGRLPVDDGADFFRVLASRAAPTPAGLLVLLARVDVPFGVFLAAGAVLAFAFGGPALEALFGPLSPFPSRLLP